MGEEHGQSLGIKLYQLVEHVRTMGGNEQYVIMLLCPLGHPIHQLALCRREEVVFGFLQEDLAMVGLGIVVINLLEALLVLFLREAIINPVNSQDFTRYPVLDRISRIAASLPSLATIVLKRHEQRLHGIALSLLPNASLVLERRRQGLGALVARFAPMTKLYIERRKQRLETIAVRVSSADPKTLLKKGYSITTFEGRIVRDH